MNNIIQFYITSSVHRASQNNRRENYDVMDKISVTKVLQHNLPTFLKKGSEAYEITSLSVRLSVCPSNNF
jgi:hypothetical protein